VSEDTRLQFVCSNGGQHKTRPVITLWNWGLANGRPTRREIRAWEKFRSGGPLELPCPFCSPREPMPHEAVWSLFDRVPEGAVLTIDISTGATLLKW
jgi:hypothetical protein